MNYKSFVIVLISVCFCHRVIHTYPIKYTRLPPSVGPDGSESKITTLSTVLRDTEKDKVKGPRTYNSNILGVAPTPFPLSLDSILSTIADVHMGYACGGDSLYMQAVQDICTKLRLTGLYATFTQVEANLRKDFGPEVYDHTCMYMLGYSRAIFRRFLMTNDHWTCEELLRVLAKVTQ